MLVLVLVLVVFVFAFVNVELKEIDLLYNLFVVVLLLQLLREKFLSKFKRLENVGIFLNLFPIFNFGLFNFIPDVILL